MSNATETTIADDGPISLPVAALIALQKDPQANIFHRAIMLTLAAVADQRTGHVGTVSDVDLKELLQIPGTIAAPTRRWLVNQGHLIETAPGCQGHAATIRLGQHLMRIASATNRANQHYRPRNEERAA